jgi:hypothetical protein
MGARHLGNLLSLVRQGLTVDVEFGTRSIEALVWVAESVEEGVYASGSLARSADALRFALDNPPLRVGAFSTLRVYVDGRPVAADLVTFRPGVDAAWRSAASVSADRTFDLAPGTRTEFELKGSYGSSGNPLTVRLELRTASVPPLVWFEFTETPATAEPGP